MNRKLLRFPAANLIKLKAYTIPIYNFTKSCNISKFQVIMTSRRVVNYNSRGFKRFTTGNFAPFICHR